VDFEKLRAEMRERDEKDLTRSVGPLKKADDAMAIDTTALTIEETVETIMKRVIEQK
jgi:CMP/dCMP kinase